MRIRGESCQQLPILLHHEECFLQRIDFGFIGLRFGALQARFGIIDPAIKIEQTLLIGLHLSPSNPDSYATSGYPQAEGPLGDADLAELRHPIACPTSRATWDKIRLDLALVAQFAAGGFDNFLLSFDRVGPIRTLGRPMPSRRAKFTSEERSVLPLEARDVNKVTQRSTLTCR